jgi:hypothetical protein
MRRHLLIALAVLVAASSCKPPRPPREANEVRISGDWIGVSGAVAQPVDTGNVEWRIRIDEDQAGKFQGRGVRVREGKETEFQVDGIRGESFLTLEFDIPDNQIKYEGTIMDIKTIVGEMMTKRDTIALSLTRVR